MYWITFWRYFYLYDLYFFYIWTQQLLMKISETNKLSASTLKQKMDFHEIYDKYVSVMRYVGLKYVADESAVEDILQDCFVSVWERWENFQNEVVVKSFLYTLVKNRCLNFLRHQKTQKKYTKGPIDEPLEDSMEKIIEAEIAHLLHLVFEELPPACKEVYQLSLEGKSHEEVARILDISVNTVKKYKNNANHYMRNRIKDISLILSILKFSNLKNNLSLS